MIVTVKHIYYGKKIKTYKLDAVISWWLDYGLFGLSLSVYLLGHFVHANTYVYKYFPVPFAVSG